MAPTVVLGLSGLVAGIDENRRVARIDRIANPAAQELLAFHHPMQPDAPVRRRLVRAPSSLAAGCPAKIAVGLGGAGDMLAGLV